jgi:hypothetical protein
MVKLSRTGLAFLGFVGFAASVSRGSGGCIALDEGFAGTAAVVTLLTTVFGLDLAVALEFRGAVPCGLVREVTMI